MMTHKPGIGSQQLFQHLVAFELAHLHVEQHDVGQALLARGEQLVGMAEGADGVQPVVLERVFQIIAEIGIVVENGEIHQPVDGRGIGRSIGSRLYRQLNSLLPRGGRAEAGSVTSRQAPPSVRLDAAMVPPCW